MKVASPLVVASALSILAACTAVAQDKYPTSTAGPIPNCANNCTVVVTVPAGCGSGIRVSLDPITVPPRNTTVITFDLATPNWKFAPNGIEIQGVASQVRDAFGDKPEEASASTFRFRHSNRMPATFKYDVNLIDPQGAPCKLDPIIVDW